MKPSRNKKDGQKKPGDLLEVDLGSLRFVSETALTVRGTRRTTTVPKAIVEAMGLREGDRLRWVMFEDRTILLTRARASPKGR